MQICITTPVTVNGRQWEVGSGRGEGEGGRGGGKGRGGSGRDSPKKGITALQQLRNSSVGIPLSSSKTKSSNLIVGKKPTLHPIYSHKLLYKIDNR